MWNEIYHEIIRRTKRWAGAVILRKKTQITVETDRIWVIGRQSSVRAWCPQCEREVDMVGLAEAHLLTGISKEALRGGGVERREWHATEAADGAVSICLESLLKSL